jgi:hypothetical protein
MISVQEKKDLKTALDKCNNINEMFDLLSAVFDLDNAKLNFVTKPLFIEGILKGIDLANPNKRKL